MRLETYTANTLRARPRERALHGHRFQHHLPHMWRFKRYTQSGAGPRRPRQTTHRRKTQHGSSSALRL